MRARTVCCTQSPPSGTPTATDRALLSRRPLLLLLGGGFAGALLPRVGAASAASQADSQGAAMSTVERTSTRISGLKSPEMDFQLMRSLGAANYGGATP